MLKKELYLSPFPITAWKVVDTNVHIFLTGPLRGGNLQGYELRIEVLRYTDITEKGKLWQWLRVTKKLDQALQRPFFPLDWVSFICCSYSLGIANGAGALGFQKALRPIETGV